MLVYTVTNRYWTLNDPEFATRATIQPGEYKCFTMESFRIGRYSVEFRGSSRATDDGEYKDMLNILQTWRYPES